MGQSSSKRRSFTPGKGKAATLPRANGDESNGIMDVHDVSGGREASSPISPTSSTSTSPSSPSGKKEKRKRFRVGFSLKRTPSGRWSRKKKRSSENGTRPVSYPGPLGDEPMELPNRPQSLFLEEVAIDELDNKIETVDLSDHEEEKSKSQNKDKSAPKTPEKSKGKRGSNKTSSGKKKKKEKQTPKKDKKKKQKAEDDVTISVTVTQPEDEVPVSATVTQPEDEVPINVTVNQPEEQIPVSVTVTQPENEVPISASIAKIEDDIPVNVTVNKPDDENPVSVDKLKESKESCHAIASTSSAYEQYRPEVETVINADATVMSDIEQQEPDIDALAAAIVAESVAIAQERLRAESRNGGGCAPNEEQTFSSTNSETSNFEDCYSPLPCTVIEEEYIQNLETKPLSVMDTFEEINPKSSMTYCNSEEHMGIQSAAKQDFSHIDTVVNDTSHTVIENCHLIINTNCSSATKETFENIDTVHPREDRFCPESFETFAINENVAKETETVLLTTPQPEAENHELKSQAEFETPKDSWCRTPEILIEDTLQMPSENSQSKLHIDPEKIAENLIHIEAENSQNNLHLNPKLTGVDLIQDRSDNCQSRSHPNAVLMAKETINVTSHSELETCTESTKFENKEMESNNFENKNMESGNTEKKEMEEDSESEEIAKKIVEKVIAAAVKTAYEENDSEMDRDIRATDEEVCEKELCNQSDNSNGQADSPEDEHHENETTGKNVKEIKEEKLKLKRKKMKKEEKTSERTEKDKPKPETKVKVPKKLSNWFHKKSKHSKSEMEIKTVTKNEAESSADSKHTKENSNTEQIVEATPSHEEHVSAECPSTSVSDDLVLDVNAKPLAAASSTPTNSSLDTNDGDTPSGPSSPASPNSDAGELVLPTSPTRKKSSSGFLKKISLGPRLKTVILRKKSNGSSVDHEKNKASVTQPSTVQSTMELTPPPRKTCSRKSEETSPSEISEIHGVFSTNVCTSPSSPLATLNHELSVQSKTSEMNIAVDDSGFADLTSPEGNNSDLSMGEESKAVHGLGDMEDLNQGAKTLSESATKTLTYNSADIKDLLQTVSPNGHLQKDEDCLSPLLYSDISESSFPQQVEGSKVSEYFSPLESPKLVSTATIILRSTSIEGQFPSTDISYKKHITPPQNIYSDDRCPNYENTDLAYADAEENSPMLTISESSPLSFTGNYISDPVTTTFETVTIQKINSEFQQHNTLNLSTTINLAKTEFEPRIEHCQVQKFERLPKCESDKSDPAETGFEGSCHRVRTVAEYHIGVSDLSQNAQGKIAPPDDPTVTFTEPTLSGKIMGSAHGRANKESTTDSFVFITGSETNGNQSGNPPNHESFLEDFPVAVDNKELAGNERETRRFSNLPDSRELEHTISHVSDFENGLLNSDRTRSNGYHQGSFFECSESMMGDNYEVSFRHEDICKVTTVNKECSSKSGDSSDAHRKGAADTSAVGLSYHHEDNNGGNSVEKSSTVTVAEKGESCESGVFEGSNSG